MTTQTYTPTQLDRDWCEQTINLLRDGGLWGFPAAAWTFQINKTTRCMILIDGDAPESSDLLQDLWIKTVATFATQGYTLINGLTAEA